MKAKRIFIVNQADDSQKYGVGKYINEIIEEAKQRAGDFDLINVLIGAPDIVTTEKNQKDNITYLKIPRPVFQKGNIQGLSNLYSKSVFILLYEIYQFNNTDTFHFNSNMQHFLMKCIREHTKAKIIYTIHVSLWKTYYNNDYNRFILDFKDSKSDSFSKKNIKAEIENCKLSDQVICLSESMRKDVLEIYEIPKNKVHKIPNGIKEQRITTNDFNEIKTIKDSLNLKEKDFVFLYIGRLNSQKGITHLINSFKRILQEKKRRIKLLIVGEGIIKEHLIRECTGFEQHIIFTGYVPSQRVKIYYRLANALIFPSLNEQSSYVMLEAMSYKIPMIVTKIDSFSMLKNNFSCLKINLNKSSDIDIDSLDEKIKLMLELKELRKKIADNAYNLYVENYSVEEMFNRLYLS